MKNIIQVFMAVIAALFLTSCGINSAMIQNQNQNSTQVHLTTNNYKVVDRVTGSADIGYVLLFGGMNKMQLYENAYSDMMKKANLSNGSRAMVNIIFEEQFRGLFPIAFSRTITVSANVIEFTN